MSFIHTLKRMFREPASARNRPGNLLNLEVLEDRVCLTQNPYLFVTSYATDSVMRYDELTGDPAPADGQTGAYYIPSGGGGLSSPLEVLFTPDGDLLVDSAEANAVYHYDATGAIVGEFIDHGAGGLQNPTGMIFSPDSQYFYVLSNFNNRIIRFDYDGTQGLNPVTLVSGAQLGGPAGAVFGPDGNLYISTLSTNSVLRYDPITGDPLPADGQSGADFIPAGSGGLNRAGGIAFGPDGNLYVTSQTNNEILRFDGTTGDPLPGDGQDGAVFVPADSGGMSKPAGLLFGPGSTPDQQDIYVVSINTNNVLRFDGGTGDFVSEFIPAGSGGLFAPRSISFGNTDPSSLNYIPGTAPGAGRGSGHGLSKHPASSGLAREMVQVLEANKDGGSALGQAQILYATLSAGNDIIARTLAAEPENATILRTPDQGTILHPGSNAEAVVDAALTSLTTLDLDALALSLTGTAR